MYKKATNLVKRFCKEESTLTNKVNPAYVGKPSKSDENRDLFLLPLKISGLKNRKLTHHSEDCLRFKNVEGNLKDESISEATQKLKKPQLKLGKETHKRKIEKKQFPEKLTEEKRQMANKASEKGVSIWQMSCR